MTTTKRVRSAVARGISGKRFEAQVPGRASAAVIDAPRVDREAGIIRGASAMQAVEALGHGVTIDERTLEMIVELGNSGIAGGGHGPATAGVKVRFTHPGLCADGMGKLLGRMRDFRIEGDKVVGDIYLAASSANSPEGDLRGYVLQLAEEDPQSFGMSVVIDATHVWKTASGDEVPVAYDDDGYQLPAPEDVIGDLPVLRPSSLHAVDVVDEAAANRDGLFGVTIESGILQAFKGTTSAAAVEAFAQLDQLREQLGLSIDQTQSFLARYFAARRTTTKAGAKPETTEASMAIKPVRLAELCKANSAHSQHIIERFAADADEATIVAELGQLQLAASVAEISRLQAELVAEKGKNKAEADAALAASAKLAAAETRLAELGAVATAPVDPGPGDTPGSTPSKPIEASKADLQHGKFSADDVLSGRVVIADAASAVPRA